MGVPIAVYFPFAPAVKGFSEGLAPEYEVVHVSSDKDTAAKELAAAVSGSGPKVPKGVVVGGRLSDDEFEAISSAIKSKNSSVRVVRTTREDLVKAGVPVPPEGSAPPSGPPSGPPSPEMQKHFQTMNKLLKDKLAGI